MANKTYYERGDTFVDANDKPAIIKKGNQLTFTDDFKAGGGADIAPATANTLGGVKIGAGVNVSNDGTISVSTFDLPTGTDEVLTPYHWVDGNTIYAKRVTGNVSQYSTLVSGVSHLVGIIGYRTDGREYGVSGGDLQIQSSSGNIQWGISSGGTLNVIIFYSKTAPVVETNTTRAVKKSTSKKG